MPRNEFSKVVSCMASIPPPNQLKKAILELAELPRGFMKLALLLRDLKNVDQIAFNSVTCGKYIKRRRAYELVKIADTFGNIDVSIERLEGIGWTKLAVLARHGIEPAIAKGYLDLAERASVHHLAAQMKALTDAPDTRVVLLRLTPDHYDAYRACMIAYGAQTASNGKGLVGQEKALMAMIAATRPSS